MFLNCGIGEDSWESWTAKRSKQSILKEISPGCSLEVLLLTLKLQYFGHLMQITDFIWKVPDAGKDRRQEKKGMTEDEMVEWCHWHDGHAWANSGSWWWTGKPGVLQSMGLQRVGHNWVTELIRSYKPHSTLLLFLPLTASHLALLTLKRLRSHLLSPSSCL